MKTLALQVPDRLAQQMQELVDAGWFVDESELSRQALSRFVQQSRFELQERFQREDIRWATGLKERKA